MAVPKRQVLGAYKYLLRAQQVVFGNDAMMRSAAATQARQEFVKNKDERDPEKVKEMLAKAHEVADFLKTNIVQGVQNEQGTYDLHMNRQQVEKNVFANVGFDSVNEELIQRTEAGKEKEPEKCPAKE